VLDDLGYGWIHANVISFGFQHGLVTDADITVDVREVSGLRGPDTQNLLARVAEECDRHLRYHAVDRRFPRRRLLLRVAVGSDDGQLRAAALAADLGGRLRRAGWGVDIVHRDLDCEAP
jgi:RNase adapter protein RapZ